MTGLRAAARPCGNCPWRQDSPAGEFPPDRYEALRTTSRRPDQHGWTDAQLWDPLFACHKTAEGKEIACAGWLAVEGRNHVRVRVALLTGELSSCQLEPGPGWPALFDCYDTVAARNGAPAPADPR